MGLQLIQVLAALPLGVTLTSATICAIAAKLSAEEDTSSPTSVPSSDSTIFARRKSTFDYTRLASNDLTSDESPNAQPKATEIKVRNVLLFFGSMVPTAFMTFALILSIISDSTEGTLFQRLFAPVVSLAGWLLVLATHLLVITHRVKHMKAIQPLQWFYSTTVFALLYVFWIRLDQILYEKWAADMWVFFGVSGVVFILWIVAITMPAELDIDFVHRHGYGYSSVCATFFLFVLPKFHENAKWENCIF